jgi:hypothetical protein
LLISEATYMAGKLARSAIEAISISSVCAPTVGVRPMNSPTATPRASVYSSTSRLPVLARNRRVRGCAMSQARVRTRARRDTAES